jgi:hypothetical protein
MYETDFNMYAGTTMRKNHLPDITLKDFLSAIKVFFSTSIFLKNGQLKFEMNKDILNSSDVIDWTNKSFKYYDELLGNYFNGFLLKYSLDSGDSYLSSKIINTGLNKKADVATKTDLPKLETEIGDIRLVKDENKFYICKRHTAHVSNPIYWDLLGLNIEDFKALNDATLINYPITELDSKESYTVNELYPESVRISGSRATRAINIPYIYEQGSSKEFKLGYNPIPFRLLLYWGSQNGGVKTSDGHPDYEPPIPPSYGSSSAAEMEYPFASIDNFDVVGNQLGNYALRFDGPYGLYENFHKEWLAFRNQAKKLTIKIILDAADLLQLELSKKIQIKECQYLIHKVRGTVQPISNKIECIVELYKL